MREFELALPKSSSIDKELIAVARISIDDMLLFPCLPYKFDCPIKKHLEPRSHPFAYIDLDYYNRNVAKEDLHSIDLIVRKSRKLSRSIPRSICIPVDDVVFEQKDVRYGYTKLICNPFTNSGRFSKYPVRLSFMTDLSKLGNSTHGNIFYNANGKASKADIYIWKNSVGYFFKLGLVDDSLIIKQITSTIKMNTKGLPEIIYKRAT